MGGFFSGESNEPKEKDTTMVTKGFPSGGSLDSGGYSKQPPYTCRQWSDFRARLVNMSRYSKFKGHQTFEESLYCEKQIKNQPKKAT